jgi:hypothetical protein
MPDWASTSAGTPRSRWIAWVWHFLTIAPLPHGQGQCPRTVPLMNPSMSFTIVRGSSVPIVSPKNCNIPFAPVRPLAIRPIRSSLDHAVADEEIAHGNVEHAVDGEVATEGNPQGGRHSDTQRARRHVDVPVLDPRNALGRLPNDRQRMRIVRRQFHAQAVAGHLLSFVDDRVGAANAHGARPDDRVHGRITGAHSRPVEGSPLRGRFQRP